MASSRPALVANTSNTRLKLSARVPFAGPSHGDDGSAEPPYVTDLVSFPLSSCYAAVDSLSRVKLLDRTTLKTLHEITDSSIATNDTAKTVRSIGRIDQAGNEGLVVTYEDGSVGLFDARLPGKSPRMTLSGPSRAPCMCASASTSGTYLASGTEQFQHEATIRIHDTRAGKKPIHVYTDTHSDDVSTLSFHSEQDHLLLSGSMDGLSSTIDVRTADEDDAILHTANVGASLSKVGWVPLPGQNGPWQGTFALTNMETLSLYDAGDEMSLVRDFGDVRDLELPDWQTHYVIDCQGLPGGLALTCGTREGAAAVMQVPLQGDWSLEQVLSGGHSDIVRACRLDLSTGSAATCSEDGTVCLWSASSQASSSEMEEPAQVVHNAAVHPSRLGLVHAEGSLKASADRETKSARYAPY